MNNINFHRLLKRQIKEHFGDISNVPEQFLALLNSVNDAYRTYDSDHAHLENILRLSSEELYQANSALKNVNETNQAVIKEKTKVLSTVASNLQHAERIAMIGNFTLPHGDGMVEMSEQLLEMLNPGGERIIPLDEFFSFFTDAASIYQLIEDSIINGDRVQDSEMKLVRDPDKCFLFEGQMIRDSVYGEEDYFLGIIQDITILRQQQKTLRDSLESLANYKYAIDQAAIVSMADPHGIITYANEMFEKVSGYKSEELLGKPHNILNSGFHEKKFFRHLWSTIAAGKVWKGIVRNKKKNGDFYWVDTIIIPFMKDGVIAQYFSVRYDITDKISIHEKVEDQRKFYEDILNSIPVDIAVFNMDHKYLFVNPQAVANPEIRNFLVGHDDYEYCEHFGKDPSIADKRRALFNRVVDEKKIFEYIDEIKLSNGKTKYVLRGFYPGRNVKGEINFVTGYGVDITEKMQQEIELKKSLEEKEALLGEVHHRVKNNLAMVLGLIELQAAKITDPKVQTALRESSHRITAMSLIHEKLYKSHNFARIELADYLKDLVLALGGFFDAHRKTEIIFDLEKISVDPQKAIPLGLITNELITNAFKYAFIDRAGKLNVQVRMNEEEEVILSISDNGPGMPEGFDPMKQNSLGFKLLSLFVKQLKGKADYGTKDGFRFSVTFKR